LLDWFEVDLGFTELSFIQIDLKDQLKRLIKKKSVQRPPIHAQLDAATKETYKKDI